jgi:hypothetical protein
MQLLRWLGKYLWGGGIQLKSNRKIVGFQEKIFLVKSGQNSENNHSVHS